jgi:hypothetical protein
VTALFFVVGTVGSGGWLMEYFLLSAAPWSVLALYKDYLKSKTEQKWQKILELAHTRFTGWLLFHVSSIGTNGRSQLFYFTVVAKHFGLSREGIRVMHDVGYGVSPTMYDTTRQQEETKSQRRLQEAKKKPHVQWWDNFSKFHAHSVPTVRKNTFSQCLWTGVTVNEYTGPPVDVNVKYSPEGDLVPAMPTDLFALKDDVLSQLASVFDGGFDLFSTSLVSQYSVNSVPLKIDTKRYSDVAPLINTSKNTTQFIHPDRLLRHNIGSNRGLCAILRSFQDDHKMHLQGSCQQYQTVNLDENIYYRVLKVLLWVVVFLAALIGLGGCVSISYYY